MTDRCMFASNSKKELIYKLEKTIKTKWTAKYTTNYDWNNYNRNDNFWTVFIPKQGLINLLKWKKIKICTQEYSPVCASKWIWGPAKTYSNACLAKNNNAKILYKGKCKENYNKVSCWSLNWKILDIMPKKTDKNLCKNWKLIRISKDFPWYYWSCKWEDNKIIYCKAKMNLYNFILKKIYIKNNYVSINYSYLDKNSSTISYKNKEVIFKYAYDNKHKYSFTNNNWKIELWANYKYKIISGKKYAFIFIDKKTQKELYRWVFQAK